MRLSDGSNDLRGRVLSGFCVLPSKKQHVFLFHSKDGFEAFAWVEHGGTSLAIPRVPSGAPDENAYVLSGDIYTFAEVYPDDGVVILSSATPEWLRKLR